MTFSPEVQEILDRVKSGESKYLGGKPKPPVRKPKPRREGPSRRGENLRGGERPPHYNYQEIADLWSTGLSSKEVAERIGCNLNTVRAALKAIQPEGYTGKSGPRKKKESE